mmetsp:Transcript_54468/g.177051  ORF Transcript_54468/g.177051 Transcript_54468/m.177051 type:complete len:218 (-) Transcript_54468:486-1139(-)
MASCSTPAEKTILPTWPEPPLRSSSVGSDFSFIPLTECRSSSMSPSGSSTDVQKNCRPPMSAAPSISTPRLPPSLMTFFSLSFFIFANSSGVGSLASFVSLSFFSSFASFTSFASFLGAASFFGAAFGSASFLSLPFLASSLEAAAWAPLAPPAAAAPRSFTSPRTALNSGCWRQRLNQRIRLPNGLRKSASRTSFRPSVSAQHTQISAKDMLWPTT